MKKSKGDITRLPDLFSSMQMDEKDNRSRMEKLHQLLLESKRRKSLSSLYYFSKYIMGFKDMEVQPHWELCQFLEEHGHRSDCLILLPRGTFKSSVISVSYPIWRWLKNRNLRILLSSAELANSKGFLGLIRQNLEMNHQFRELFGHWEENEGGVWHSTALSVGGRTVLKAENSITASSVDVTKVSQHYDFAILDDLQTDKNVTSKELIDKIQEYLQLLIPILDPSKESVSHAPRIVVGTRWHFDDIYGRLIVKEKKRRREGKPPSLQMLVRKAVEKPAGKPVRIYFPARFSEAYLDELKESSGMSSYHFSCQYLNDPLPDESVIFNPRYVNYYQLNDDGTGTIRERITGFENGVPLNQIKTRPLPQQLNFFSLADPSVGEYTDSDYAATVTIAVDPAFNVFVWNVLRKHYAGDTEAYIEDLFETWRTYRPIRFGMEAIAFQKYLIWSFREACRQKNEYIPIEELKTDNTVTKEMRIRGFQPYWKARRVFLRVRPGVDMDKTPFDELRFYLVDGQDMLLDEAERFPLGATKDCIDALAYCPQLIFPANEAAKAGVQPGTYAWLEQQIDQHELGGLKPW